MIGRARVFGEFRKFLQRGSLIDMAVGIAVGTAFATIAKSLVSDIVMPPVGLLMGGVEFKDMFAVLKEGTPPAPYTTLAAAQDAGAVTVNYGIFINNVLAFLVIALVFFMMVRAVNRLREMGEPGTPAEPTTKTCPHCIHTIPLRATRCPQCTSELEPVG